MLRNDVEFTKGKKVFLMGSYNVHGQSNQLITKRKELLLWLNKSWIIG